VGMVRQGTCMPHVVHHVKQACWLLECSGGLRDSPGERPSLGDVPVVMCVLKAKGRCKQACWLLECSGGLRDSPGERPSLCDVPVVMCVLKAKGRCERGDNVSRLGAVGIVGQSTCMPHVVV
jgi:hypothetical protein